MISWPGLIGWGCLPVQTTLPDSNLQYLYECGRRTLPRPSIQWAIKEGRKINIYKWKQHHYHYLGDLKAISSWARVGTFVWEKVKLRVIAEQWVFTITLKLNQSEDRRKEKYWCINRLNLPYWSIAVWYRVLFGPFAANWFHSKLKLHSAISGRF